MSSSEDSAPTLGQSALSAQRSSVGSKPNVQMRQERLPALTHEEVPDRLVSGDLSPKPRLNFPGIAPTARMHFV